MLDINKLKNHTILIIPNTIKQDIISQISSQNTLLDIKYMTKEQFLHKYYFTYDEQAIYYLTQEYQIKPEIAKVYLDNLYYLDPQVSNSKIQKLIAIKDKLITNNLLIFDPIFQKNISKYNLLIYGYDYLSLFEQKMFSQLPNVEIIPKDYSRNYSHLIYKCPTDEEEAIFVIENILDLTKKGISLNQIKLVNGNSQTITTLRKYLNIFKIPFSYNEDVLYHTTIGNFYLNNLSHNIEETFEKIQATFNLKDPLNLKIYNQLINITNKYIWIKDKTQIKDLLTLELKNTKLSQATYQEALSFISAQDQLWKDEEYYFFLDFNQGIYPTIYKDEEYLTDDIKTALNLDTSITKNIQAKETAKQNLSQIKNLIITYKQQDSAGTYTLSSINEDLNYEIKSLPKSQYIYNSFYNELLLSKKIDNLLKYGEVSVDLDLLYANHHNLSYGTYQNQYTGISPQLLQEYLDNKLLLSYSSIDNYFRCSFRYYLENILKVSLYEDTFMTKIGNLFHEILSKCYSETFSFESSYQEISHNYFANPSNKEKFFLQKLEKELRFVIQTLSHHQQNISLDQHLLEQKIYVEQTPIVTFMGIIDKLLYKETPDQTIVAIIDYKTGNPSLNLNNVIYGIEMQLPIYLYLTRYSHLFKNIEIAGFYLQKILNTEITRDPKKSYEHQKQDRLKLQGYSNYSEDVLKEFDSSYQESTMIKGMKTTSKGFASYSKVLTTETMDKLIELVSQKIQESSTSILESRFTINPKKIGRENIGCQFCKFKDICFRKEKDLLWLKEYKNMEFLGGDQK